MQAGQELSLEALEREIASTGAVLARRLARWLALIAEFDRRDGARRAGHRSTAEWLAWACGLGARAAREHVRVARRLQEMPAVRCALEAGELSYSKVRALTRADSAEHEDDLLALARRSTADQLERTVRTLRSAPSADLDHARRAHEHRRLDTWWKLDGSLALHGSLPPDDGALFVEAIEAAAEGLHPLQTGGRPPLAARRADALAEIVHSGAPRAQVLLHVDAAALACAATGNEPRLGELCALDHGPAIPSETARRLACDGDIALVARPGAGAGAAGPAPDLGRRRRVVSAPLRAALERRDGGCRFPGCTRRHGLHAHHIRHWAHGGPTDRENLVLVCRYHHRLLHEEGFGVAVRDGSTVFHRPDGRPIGDLPPPVAAAA